MKRRRRNCCSMPGFGFGVILFALMLCTTSTTDNQCPVECSCLGNAVICKDLQLVGAPNGLPPWTENLILKGNNFENLEFNALLNLPKLEELDVNSNILNDNFTLSLSEQTHLKWLKINKNRLTRIPELNLMYLTHLSLSHNMINMINGNALIHYPELQYLDLSGNRITTIHKNSFLAPKLKILNLNSNQINSIEAHFISSENLSSLLELRLNKNKITGLQDVFKSEKDPKKPELKLKDQKPKNKLRILELNRNELCQIDALTFTELTSLEKLRLKRNKIENLSDGAFWPLSNLTELQLDFNALKVVRKGALFGLKHVQVFTISHNRISTIDTEAWDMCDEITELNLSHNEFNRIERNSFQSLRKLRKLQLDHNAITFIAEGAFKDLTSLQILDLNSNRISYIVEDAIGIFVPLAQLQKLDIAHNQIKSINKNAFNGLVQVEELDLTGNNVTSIQENAFLAMASTLKTLKMNTSALVCDCGLQWFSVWLRTNRYSETRLRCGYPHWLRGILLTQLHYANFTCDVYPKPRIVEEPKSQLSVKGDNVTLTCRASSTADSPLTFVWKHDNLELRDRTSQNDVEPNSVDGITLASSILNLINVTNAHAGRYQCMVSNNYGTTYSAKAKISVLIYPSFSKIPHDIRVKAGSTAGLECSAEGLPVPQIAWQKDGGNDFPAARERRMYKMPTDDVLFIVDVRTTDSGIYSCTARNLAGVITANATLTILETPSFVKPMENKEVIAGDTIVMECMASGSPRPQLFWRKNGSPLQPTERHFFTAENQLLIIVNTEPNDEGSYECEICNSLGSVTGASLLTIKAAPSSIVNEDEMLGLIIITVVCCAVGTSIIWVVIIYQTRRRLNAMQSNSSQPSATMVAISTTAIALPEVETHLYLDTSSQHSKDSGTGDSTNPSNDQLQLCLPGGAATYTVSNEDNSGKVDGDHPLLSFTNHERHEEVSDHESNGQSSDNYLTKKQRV